MSQRGGHVRAGGQGDPAQADPAAQGGQAAQGADPPIRRFVYQLTNE